MKEIETKLAELKALAERQVLFYTNHSAHDEYQLAIYLSRAVEVIKLLKFQRNAYMSNELSEMNLEEKLDLDVYKVLGGLK